MTHWVKPENDTEDTRALMSAASVYGADSLATVLFGPGTD